MRWLVVVALAACGHAAPTVIEAHHAPAPIELLPADKLIERDYRAFQLFELPGLPAKRGIDLAEDKTCRAHLQHAKTGERGLGDIEQLVRIAAQTTGDCRIDADAWIADEAPYRVGGCMGVSTGEAKLAWGRAAIVASTRARRAVALRNFAVLSWREATGRVEVAGWIETGDAFVRAAALADAPQELAAFAVDAYENALRFPDAYRLQITVEQIDQIAGKLEAITDGAAADRAYALRAITSRMAASARRRTPASASSGLAKAAP